MDHQGRLARLRAEMDRLNLDGFIVTGPANRYYLSGFTGDNGILFIDRKEQWLFSDFRYAEQAREEAPDCRFQELGRRLLPEFRAWLAKEGGARIGVETAHWSVAEYEELMEEVPPARLVPQIGVVERLRAVKDAEEIARLAQGEAINDRAFARLLPSIRPGVAERDLAAELDYLLRREGAEASAFATIVASGPRGALPHGTASEKKLARGELVVFDFGARYRGYASDITRTVAVGEPGEELRRIYRIVAEAQAEALAAIRPGQTGKEADAVARGLIEKAGYGRQFGHGLGHGVGVEVHEEPRVSPAGEMTLQPGMAVTVEPGIYLPGLAGVRIEDLVVLTDGGCHNLTKSPKELLIL